MSNFHPLFVPSELPLPLREQALKYAQSKAFSKVGAGDGANDKPKRLIKYDAVFMKSLRFKELSTNRPYGLPFIPGIAPGVNPNMIPGARCMSPIRQFPDPEKGFRLIPFTSTPFGAPPEAPFFPYIRHFTPSQSRPCTGSCGMDTEYTPCGEEEDENEDVSKFATPPFAFDYRFGAPFRYQFPAFH